MSEQSRGIPLADVLRAANELVSAGLIEDCALGDLLRRTVHDLRCLYYFHHKGQNVKRGNSCDLLASTVEGLAAYPTLCES